MEPQYQILTYFKAKKFIESLDKPRRSRIDRYYGLFEDYGPLLPSRYLKKISENVWELRPGDTRLFLTIKGNKGVVVHGIHKKTQRIPKKDLDLAVARVKEILR